jgi:hypothetical protein
MDGQDRTARTGQLGLPEKRKGQSRLKQNWHTAKSFFYRAPILFFKCQFKIMEELVALAFDNPGPVSWVGDGGRSGVGSRGGGG